MTHSTLYLECLGKLEIPENPTCPLLQSFLHSVSMLDSPAPLTLLVLEMMSARQSCLWQELEETFSNSYMVTMEKIQKCFKLNLIVDEVKKLTFN